MKLENLDDQLMTIAAFRYCLGRQSYIVGACLDWLYETWDQFTENTRQVIVRDTIEALMDGLCGSPSIDRPGWKTFAEWAMKRLSASQRDWLRRSVYYKQKPWPLES
jgi:hypothetical protein